MNDAWSRFRALYVFDPSLDFAMDASRTSLAADWWQTQPERLQFALDAMHALEAGAIANPSEGRRVGHYWLRAAELAPDAETRSAITQAVLDVEAFSKQVREGSVCAPCGKPFTDFLAIGIGGSSLGPMFLADALDRGQGLRAHFIDNTDPDGIDRALFLLRNQLSTTLVIVTSKSGTTAEPRNAQLEVQQAFANAGLRFEKHAVAITGTGSELERSAQTWLARFPMWDFVGGRTSLWSSVGLLPAALQGIDIRALLQGAAEMDRLTRVEDAGKNPALLMAMFWWSEAKGRGERSMVVLPYKDRLAFLGRYLQQLVMESLGKRESISGQVVHQGLTVYGNKGSTDQHAFVQQLRDGVHDFAVLFIEVLKERAGPRRELSPGVSAGDWLGGFLSGTRTALAGAGRGSLTLTLGDLSPRSIGALLALFERAVGFYASFAGINAYDQPGVEAGKKAAGLVLEAQGRLLAALQQVREPRSVEALAQACATDPETIFTLLRRLSANGVVRMESAHTHPLDARWQLR
jgi:glucose-6-phosphate isomerase